MDEHHATSGPEQAPPALSQDERNWGMYCHLAVLAGFVFPLGNVIGPLIIWLIKKDQYPFVDYNARQAMNFQITLVVGLLVSGLLAFIFIGFILMIILVLFAMVQTIQAIMASGKGEYFTYPYSLRLLR